MLIHAFSMKRLKAAPNHLLGGGIPASEDDYFDMFVQRAETDYKVQKYSSAIINYTQALKMRKDHQPCLMGRSKCFFFLGQYQDALKDAERSMATDKDYLPGLLAMAEINLALGKHNTAKMYYARGRKLRPQSKCFTEGLKEVEWAQLELKDGTPRGDRSALGGRAKRAGSPTLLYGVDPGRWKDVERLVIRASREDK
eukprot:tig00000655_g2874.t1